MIPKCLSFEVGDICDLILPLTCNSLGQVISVSSSTKGGETTVLISKGRGED